MAIHIQHLNKYIGKQHVLKDISLTIGDGEVVGLLGPNGAGKSTLMKIMVGVWDATDGEVAVPKNIGFLPEQNPLYEDMYVREYLRFFVGLRCKEEGSKSKDKIVEELIERVGLTAEANKRVGQLSKGYKQRVGLAQAMIGNPELLILDEPTRGIDVGTKVEIQKQVLKLAEKGVSVTFISSEIQEMLNVCSRLIVMRDRRIVGELKDEELSQDNIMSTIAGGSNHNE